MQKFRVEILVVANTVDTVSAVEIQEAVEEVLKEFDGGTAEVQDCWELN